MALLLVVSMVIGCDQPVETGGKVGVAVTIGGLLQSRKQTLTYRIIDTAGPEHDRLFTVEVMAGDTVLGRGTGKSKKRAEIDAARWALQRLSGFTG